MLTFCCIFSKIVTPISALKVNKNISYKLVGPPQKDSEVIEVEQDLRGFNRTAFAKIGTTAVFLDHLLYSMDKKRKSSKQCHYSDESDSPYDDWFKTQCNLPKKIFKKAKIEHSEASLYRLEKPILKRLARRGGKDRVLGFYYNLEEDSEVTCQRFVI